MQMYTEPEARIVMASMANVVATSYSEPVFVPEVTKPIELPDVPF